MKLGGGTGIPMSNGLDEINRGTIMKIRVLDESDARLYQELRLSALRISPDAFSSTYEREVQFSLETVIDRLKPTSDRFVLGAFADSGSLVGIVTFMRESLEQINLTVVSDNDYAKKLYKSVGFEAYGVERNALKYNEEHFNEDLMVLFL